MLNSVSSIPISYAMPAYEHQNVSFKETQTQTVALPIITTLEDQPKPIGDHAYVICLASCNAAVAAATLSPVGILICFEACLASVAVPPLFA